MNVTTPKGSNITVGVGVGGSAGEEPFCVTTRTRALARYPLERSLTVTKKNKKSTCRLQNAFPHRSRLPDAPPLDDGFRGAAAGEDGGGADPAKARLAVMRNLMTCLEASVFPAPDSPVIRMDWLRRRTRPSTSPPFVSAMYLAFRRECHNIFFHASCDNMAGVPGFPREVWGVRSGQERGASPVVWVRIRRGGGCLGLSSMPCSSVAPASSETVKVKKKGKRLS